MPDTTPAPLGFYVLVRQYDRFAALFRETALAAQPPTEGGAR